VPGFFNTPLLLPDATNFLVAVTAAKRRQASGLATVTVSEPRLSRVTLSVLQKGNCKSKIEREKKRKGKQRQQLKVKPVLCQTNFQIATSTSLTAPFTRRVLCENND